MWYTAHFPSHQHLYLTDVLCSAAGCSVPLPQAGPEITHRSRLISAVQPSPTQGARALDQRLRKVVVGLARPDTRRSLPFIHVKARDGVRARPFLGCLTASRGVSSAGKCLPDGFPLPACNMARVVMGRETMAAHLAWVGFTYIGTAARSACRLDVMGWDGH